MRLAIKSRRLAVALAICATALVLSPAAATAAPVGPGNGILAGIQLRKDLTKLCLVARIGRGERPVQQTPCANFSDQDWTFDWVDDYWFHIRNLDRNMCIVTRGTGETPAVVTACDSRYPDQLWTWVWAPNDSYTLANKNSKLCLVGRFESQATQTACNIDFSDQRWHFELS
jgi:hypothetical protein